MISMIHEGDEEMNQIGQASPSRSVNYDEVRRSIGDVNSSMKKSVRSSLSQVSKSTSIKKEITAEERGLTYGKKIRQDVRGEDSRLRRSFKVDFSYGPSDALKDISAIINNKESITKQSKAKDNSEVKGEKERSTIFSNNVEQNNQQRLRQSIPAIPQQQPKIKQKPVKREGNSSAIREKKSKFKQQGIISLILFLIFIYLILIIKCAPIRFLQTTVIQPFFSKYLSMGWFV